MTPKLVAAIADLHRTEGWLAREYRRIAERHAAEHDVFHLCHTLAQQCDEHEQQLASLAARRGVRLDDTSEMSPLRSALSTFRESTAAAVRRKGPPDLLADLRLLFIAASDCEIAWTAAGQGAKATRDDELQQIFTHCCDEIVGQLRWIKTRTKQAAPQTLTVT